MVFAPPLAAQALRSALRLASGPLQRRLAAMELIPPLEFPCRIEPLPEGCSTIDNSLYNDAQYASSWHSTDRSKELATLDLLNAARIPYFDRVWRRQLDLPPTRPGAFLEVRQRPCLPVPAPVPVPVPLPLPLPLPVSLPSSPTPTAPRWAAVAASPPPRSPASATT